jgi:hypothetical protein
MRIRVCLALALAVIYLPLAHAAPVVRAATDWLDAVNAIRTAAGLQAVVVNTDRNAGPTIDDAVAHSKYLVLNNTISHAEDPTKPGFSASGARAGAQGDVSVGFGPLDPVATVQGFMVGGYHWEPILDPRTSAVAFGIYTDTTQAGWQSASTLVFIRTVSVQPTAPVLWPPDGGQAPAALLSRGPGESPDPMGSCVSFSQTTGASISLQFTTVPHVTAVTLTQDGAAVPVTSCWFSATTVQFSTTDTGVWDALGRSILQSQNVVELFPRQPLGPGVYHVSVTNNGTTVCRWSFSVGQAAPPPDNACGPAAAGTTVTT